MEQPSPTAPPGGPGPHEDLTIGEHVESMRISRGQRPGEACLKTAADEETWLREEDLERFLAKHGAEHPSDFLASHGTEWQNALFQFSTITNHQPSKSMTNEFNQEHTGQLSSAAERAEKAIREASAKAGRVVSEKSSEALNCTSQSIRKYPVSSVAGAFVFGIAVGCLIACTRHTPTFYERYLNDPLDHANDALAALRRKSPNLKFW